MRKCRICNVEVNTYYGCYCCPSCNYIFHVNCAIEDYNWYDFDKPKTIPVDQSLDSIIPVNDDGTGIGHFSHEHNLVISDDIEDGYKLCDGCILFISAPYYSCSKCDFFLQKSCAELPRKKKLWFHKHQILQTIISDRIFACGVCDCECSGFACKCPYPSFRNTCLRCALTDSHTSQGHEHPLFFYEKKKKEHCKACGEKSTLEYWCNDCNFILQDKCLKLPHIARHKCDEHPLKLTYHDDNDYVEYHYCDICEETRKPNHWFYRCAICNSSACRNCSLGKYPFIKRGSSYNNGDHPQQPLIFVEKVYDFPECHKYRKPCLDLALECAETVCNYIVHWECIKPFPASSPASLKMQ